MEALPLELRQHIFASLLPHHERSELTVLPTTSTVERHDIYNLRLTSRRSYEGAWPVFTRIIEDVPTECKEESFLNLEALVDMADVSSHLTCLSINTCVLFLTGDQSKQTIQEKILKRKAWLRLAFEQRLSAVIGKAARLRHAVYQLCRPQQSEILSGRSRNLEDRLRSLPDLMNTIQDVMVATRLTDALETMTLLGPSPPLLWDWEQPRTRKLPITYTHLQHLTLAPIAYYISDFCFRAPHITSLHVVLDDFFSDTNLMESHGTYFPELVSGLQKYTISGLTGLVESEILLKFIVPVFTRYEALPLLTIRNMTTVVDINFEMSEIRGSGRIQLLLFENFNYCLTDDITLSGPSESRAVDQRWAPLAKLLERVDKTS
ncbi:hypothetical protein FB567DRAFT_33336 [Paraphoma chrysanthemicola]|uniref:Uncharacterized protein n=1 Tax=Paraphoma chrysanthemicola TaxID=798071 RepID=A0A8K0RIC4_9PLEO|nr:hypothetical protein FB567DRAFT_33336 [Paraphoma chrysanthemicola]